MKIIIKKRIKKNGLLIYKCYFRKLKQDFLIIIWFMKLFFNIIKLNKKFLEDIKIFSLFETQSENIFLVFIFTQLIKNKFTYQMMQNLP